MLCAINTYEYYCIVLVRKFFRKIREPSKPDEKNVIDADNHLNVCIYIHTYIQPLRSGDVP